MKFVIASTLFLVSAKCKICKCTYSRKGRTTSKLRNHLSSKHPDELKALRRVEKKREENKKENDLHQKFKKIKQITLKMCVE